MKTKLNGLLTLFFALMMQISFAQERTVTGTVTDEGGFPIPGVNILIKGTQTGTQTDFDGNYEIQATPDQILVFTFIGMGKQEIPATSTTINVVMQDQATELEGIVITSLGIRRDKRALGYATTTVKNEQLTNVVNTNPMESLSGKIAGADIAAPASPGAAPKVVIRGFNSITGNNGPLYVVDGTPINNSFNGSTSITRSFDAGSGINDLDPNNIESITVLKGAAASALYGSRAGNGVVIITTKKGLERGESKINVNFSSTMELNEVARVAHMQNRFGQGWNGLGYTAFSGGNGPSNENGSWGPAFNGEIRPWGTVYNNSQQIKPYVALEDNVRDFYDIGTVQTNNINISGAGERSDFSLSFTDLKSDGIVPTNTDQYMKRTLSFNGGLYSDKFEARTSINYTNKDQNAVNTGQGDDAGEGSTLQQDLMQIPRDISIVDLADYQNNPFNTPSYYFTPYATNPWFGINENSTNIKGNNLFGNVNLKYNITDELTASWQIGGNIRNESIKSYGAIVDYLPGSPQAIAAANPVVGGVTETRIERSEFDTYFTLNYLKNFNKFTLNVLGGLAYNKRELNSLSASVTALDVPDYYELSNSANRPTIVQQNELRKTYGAYIQAELSYENRYFLTLSGRNDWTSTLPVQENSYFYPAASVSAVVLDTGDNYVKVRGAVSQIANDTDPYNTESSLIAGSSAANFGIVAAPLGGVNYYELGPILGNNKLKPERTTETEFGVEANLFATRVTLDASVYYATTKDLIVQIPIDPSTGYTLLSTNLADVVNKGVEVALGFTPVKTPDFSWIVNYTFSKNINEVTRVDGDAKVRLTAAYGISYYAEEGKPIGAFYGRAPVVTDDGQYVVNPDTGYYEVTEEEQYLGDSQRDFIMGLQNTFKYKGLSLFFSFDWKQGGKMYSYTKRLNHFVGNGIETIYNDRNPFIIPNSVIDNGDGTYSENTTPVSFENVTNYWGNTTNNPGIERGHLIDRSFIRLRDISLTYSFPKSVTDPLGLTSLSFGIYGKNMFLWTPHNNPYVDPEMTSYGNDLLSEFGEFGANPSQRGYGAILKLSF